MSDPKAVYGGIEISYDEQKNKWVFELDGKEHKSDSLTNAKAAIDKPAPVKKVPFKKISCFKAGGWGSEGGFVPGHITSFVESSYGGSYSWAWFTNVKDGSRSKESVRSMYQDTQENREIMSHIKALNKEREDIHKKIEAQKKQLKTVEPPTDETP